jgi:L-lactate dehydrogenase complex protein LldE
MRIMSSSPRPGADRGPAARPTRVQLLVTCLVDQFFPDTGMAVATLLERLGLSVEVPASQTCCGQPAFNAGFTDDARDMARHTIDVLSASDAPIVIPSGSCGDMVIHQYATLLKDDLVYGPKAAALEARTYELTQFLVDVLGVTDVGAVAGGKVTYHACCHGLRGLGVQQQPRQLLDAVKGVERCDLEESEVCCGFGGLFAIKMSDISSAMLGRKLDCIEATTADTVIVTDVSCAMHMNGGLHRRGSRTRVRHLADLLAGPS